MNGLVSFDNERDGRVTISNDIGHVTSKSMRGKQTTADFVMRSIVCSSLIDFIVARSNRIDRFFEQTDHCRVCVCERSGSHSTIVYDSSMLILMLCTSFIWKDERRRQDNEEEKRSRKEEKKDRQREPTHMSIE
jgi:hypothetical protein